MDPTTANFLLVWMQSALPAIAGAFIGLVAVICGLLILVRLAVRALEGA